jgi:hypothetical protein
MSRHSLMFVKYLIVINYVCKISDCYQSRPLMKLTSSYKTDFYEFEIGCYEIRDEVRSVVLYSSQRDSFATLWDNGWQNDLEDKNLRHNTGSIFSELNKFKYLRLYKEVCKYIKNNH